MTKFIDLTLNGISTGAIYAAVALALVLIWRATRIVNFAQGAMLMITTFIASAVINSSGSYWLGFVVALAVRAGARRDRRARADPPGRERAAAERGDPDARPVHAARGDRRDDLGQHAALVSRGVLAARLHGRRHDAAVHAQRHVHRADRDRGGGGAGAAVPRHRRSACRCARRRSRPRSPGCSASASAGCSRWGGRWPRWSASLAGVLVAPSVFLGPNSFDPILIVRLRGRCARRPRQPAGRGDRRADPRARAVLRVGLRGLGARAAGGAGDPGRSC